LHSGVIYDVITGSHFGMPNPHTADADYWKKGEEATVYTNLEQCKQYKNSSADEIINVNVFTTTSYT